MWLLEVLQLACILGTALAQVEPYNVNNFNTNNNPNYNNVNNQVYNYNQNENSYQGYQGGLNYGNIEELRCPEHWLHFQYSCYRFIKSPLRDYSNARKICQVSLR